MTDVFEDDFKDDLLDEDQSQERNIEIKQDIDKEITGWKANHYFLRPSLVSQKRDRPRENAVNQKPSIKLIEKKSLPKRRVLRLNSFKGCSSSNQPSPLQSKIPLFLKKEPTPADLKRISEKAMTLVAAELSREENNFNYPPVKTIEQHFSMEEQIRKPKTKPSSLYSSFKIPQSLSRERLDTKLKIQPFLKSNLNMVATDRNKPPAMKQYLTSRLSAKAKKIRELQEQKRDLHASRLVQAFVDNNAKLKPSPMQTPANSNERRPLPLSFASTGSCSKSDRKSIFKKQVQLEFDSKINSLRVSIVDSREDAGRKERRNLRILDFRQMKINKESLKMVIN